MQKYNIALVFEDDVSSQIITYAEKLYAHTPSRVLLGKNSTPHVTLIHFTASQSVKDDILQASKNLSFQPLKLNLSGINVVSSKNKGTWIEISVLKSNALSELQQSIIALLPKDITPHNPTGDLYRPHVTLSNPENTLKTFEIPITYLPLKLQNITSHIALGTGTKFSPCLEVLSEK